MLFLPPSAPRPGQMKVSTRPGRNPSLDRPGRGGDGVPRHAFQLRFGRLRIDFLKALHRLRELGGPADGLLAYASNGGYFLCCFPVVKMTTGHVPIRKPRRRLLPPPALSSPYRLPLALAYESVRNRLFKLAQGLLGPRLICSVKGHPPPRHSTVFQDLGCLRTLCPQALRGTLQFRQQRKLQRLAGCLPVSVPPAVKSGHFDQIFLFSRPRLRPDGGYNSTSGGSAFLLRVDNLPTRKLFNILRCVAWLLSPGTFCPPEDNLSSGKALSAVLPLKRRSF